MATILPADVSGLELSRVFRSPRCYAPELVTAMLATVVGTSPLALVVDLDALERSLLARVDRVMQLALTSLSSTGMAIVLIARYERECARRLLRQIPAARVLFDRSGRVIEQARSVAPGASIIALTDEPSILQQLGERDRGLALGRPELARATIAPLGDASVRATLWWLYETRLSIIS